MPFVHDSSLNFPSLKQHNLSVGRVYLVENGPQAGQVYPSITRILAAKPKPGLEAWKKRVGPKEAARVSARASAQGGNVHKLSECYLGNETLPQYGPNVQELWHHLAPWLDENITTVFAQEQNVYSDKLKVAGRVDVLAQVRGHNAVVDIKTALREKREEYVRDYFLQCCFYSCAAYELTGISFSRLVLPVVAPNGVQLFESTTAAWFVELRSRINEFYAGYEPSANTP